MQDVRFTLHLSDLLCGAGSLLILAGLWAACPPLAVVGLGGALLWGGLILYRRRP